MSNFDTYNFYQSKLGQEINSALIDKINSLKIDVYNKQILEVGYPLFEKTLTEKKAANVISCIIPKFIDQEFKIKQDDNNILVDNDSFLPFQNCSFDIIILNHSLEHSSNLTKFLKEVWRVLADGGIVIILTPSFFNVLRFLKKNPYYKTKSYFSFTLLKILKDNDFSIKELSYFKCFPKTFLTCVAEKKMFSPILNLNKKYKKSKNRKYATAINYSSNFKKITKEN